MENLFAPYLFHAVAPLWGTVNFAELGFDKEEKKKILPQNILLERHHPPCFFSVEGMV